LPSTPQPIETPITQLAGIFGGVKNKILKGFASSDQDIARNRSPSLGRSDPHAEPSVALSNMMAAGLVNAPSLPQDLNPSSSGPSPNSSRATSAAGHRDTANSKAGTESLSRASSLSSITSRNAEQGLPHGYAKSMYLPLLREVNDDRPISQSILRNDSSEDQVARAKEEQFRRLIEDAQQRTSPAITDSDHTLGTQDACPPSPDDIIFEQKLTEAYEQQTHQGDFSRLNSPGKSLIPSSSDDRFTSEMSQSTSDRSLPSAFSATSSIGMEFARSSDGTAKYASADQVDAVRHATTAAQTSSYNNHYESNHLTLQQPGYEEDDYSDDSFIEMSRPKRPDSAPVRGTSSSSRNVRPKSGFGS
jgi:hypothetical protein